MANCEVKKETVERVVSVTLHLTEDEAKTLCGLVGHHIVGSHILRWHTASIYNALTSVGIPCEPLPVEVRFEDCLGFVEEER